MSLAISTSSLTVYFGSVAGVVDLDLEVERGEVFGFLGPNGSGKTTTIRLLLDLLRPDRGHARVLGSDVRAGGAELRSRIGYLPGDLALFPELTGAQVLDLLARIQRRPPALRSPVLERLGLPPEALDRRIRTYSTGMRQMIGITAAFQHDPELLVLDEPTTGLDPVVRDAFLTLVRERASAGKTVFLSSHVLDEVERCADRVGLLARSRLRLVESISGLRQRRGRTVRLRYADGRQRRFLSTSSPPELLEEIDRDGLADVEIRPASLDEVFKALMHEERPSAS